MSRKNRQRWIMSDHPNHKRVGLSHERDGKTHYIWLTIWRRWDGAILVRKEFLVKAGLIRQEPERVFKPIHHTS